MDGPANLDHLPDDPALLKGIVRELLATHHAQQRQIDQLTHRLDLLLKRVYGPRADKLDPSQLSLFDEPPVDSLPVAAPLPEPDAVTTTTKKNGHGRGKLPDSLRREIEVIDIPEAVKQATGGMWQKIGEERAVKPFAIGRKNWLFFGNDHSGRRLATLSSFTATCQQSGVNPWIWLKNTLTRLPTTPANQLATLLPTPTAK